MNRKNWIKSIITACFGFCLTREVKAASKTTVTTEQLCSYGMVGDEGVKYAAKIFAEALKQAGINAKITWVGDVPHRYDNPDGTIGRFQIEITT